MGPYVTTVKDAIQRAGGAAAVARAFGMSRISVYEWITKNRVPDNRVLALAELTAWEYTPHALAPRLYPNENDGLPQQVLGSA